MIIAFNGIVRPFPSRSENSVEMANEYTILLLFCHCVTQTEFVVDPRGRWATGWTLIGLIALNMTLNLVYILAGSLRQAYNRLRFLYFKRKADNKRQQDEEKAKRIKLYREQALKDVSKADDDMPG